MTVAKRPLARRRLVLGGLILAAAVSTVAAAEPVPPHADISVDTRGQVKVGPRALRYTATAGQYPIYANETGEQVASIFFVAYVADAPKGVRRPLTFLWNGGPGSNAAQVHIVGFGPKRIATPDSYPDWVDGAATPIVDNPESWLADSDLVFVDPPGTGFGRVKDGDPQNPLYTTRGDAEAVAEFIRLYLSRNDRWRSPLFIGGESYGTNRAMAVANALELRRTHLSGVILISGGFDIGQRMPVALNTALGISKWTATGHYHHLLPPDLQAIPADQAIAQAMDWAQQSYAPALSAPEALTAAARAAIKQGLHRYTGIDPRFVDDRTLRIIDYADNALRDRGLEIGHFDTRMTAPFRGDGVAWLPTRDPSLRPMVDLMEGTSVVFNDYVRKTLKFESDLFYQGPWGKGFHPAPIRSVAPGIGDDWMAARFIIGDYNLTPEEAATRRGGPPAPELTGIAPMHVPALRQAMDLNPRLTVLNITGLYDESCAVKDEALARIERSLRARVTNRCYAGGHMWYSDKAIRRQAQRDFAAFVNPPSTAIDR